MTDTGAPQPEPLGLEMDHPQLAFSRFIDAAKTFLDFLGEVSKDVAGPGGVRWVLEDASRASPVRLLVRPIAARDDVRQRDLVDLSRSISEGLAALRIRAERPPHFTDRALEKAEELARKVGPDLILVRIGDQTRRTEMTAQLVANIETVLGDVVTSLGTVEGRLEAVNVHNSRYFNVYEDLTGRRIRCDFGHRIDTHQIAVAVERRVAVFGEIRYDSNGEIEGMTAESLEVFPAAPDLPTAEDVFGILGN
jgi:hypothetical protein